MALPEFVINGALKTIAKGLLNEQVAPYGDITYLAIKDRVFIGKIRLHGIEDREITVRCQKIVISEDGSSVTLSDFDSDVACVKNALNMFGCRTFPIEGTMLRMAVSQLRGVV